MWVDLVKQMRTVTNCHLWILLDFEIDFYKMIDDEILI